MSAKEKPETTAPSPSRTGRKSPLLTTPQLILATSPRELNTSRRRSAKPSRREWCNKPQHLSCALLPGAPSRTLPRAKERRTVAFLTALRAAALFSSPAGAPERGFFEK